MDDEIQPDNVPVWPALVLPHHQRPDLQRELANDKLLKLQCCHEQSQPEPSLYEVA